MEGNEREMSKRVLLIISGGAPEAHVNSSSTISPLLGPLSHWILKNLIFSVDFEVRDRQIEVETGLTNQNHSSSRDSKWRSRGNASVDEFVVLQHQTQCQLHPKKILQLHSS